MAKKHSTNTTTLKTILYRLAEADMMFWILPPLMVLLTAGTLAQQWIGLYNAQTMFFSSFIVWLGPIPLPAGLTLLGILTFNLTLKFILKSQWSLPKSGIILTHLGALILLIGGLITAVVAEENYMIIPEGAETPFIYHHIDRNLMIFENDREILRIPYKAITNASRLETNLPFTIDILKTCNNCEILRREKSEDYHPERIYRAMAQFMALTPKPEEKEPEANLTGFEFTITTKSSDENAQDINGYYLAFDGMPKPIEFTANNRNYSLIFGKAQTTLPFSIYLKDFHKDTYTGTQKARSYHSDVIVKDNDIEWESRIEMNKPLRYKGYTFFQSSFDETPDNKEITILTVVQNEGWLFPYIGTAIFGIGLLLHTLIAFRSGKKGGQRS